jgi:putative DNA primase/helicase
VLDELGQVDPKEAGPVAYMLANGSAKARSTREGANRPMKQWRLIFLSSGEQGLEDKLSEDGKRAKAGQEVRVPDIPCPPTGMFEDSHGFPCMGQFAEHLKQQSRKHYGHAARLFIQKLCDELSRNDALQAMLKEKETAWLARVVPPGVDPQVRRVAGRFALVAVAGELAIRMGILPWPEGEAEKAAQVCFNAWLDKRGFSGASEVHKGIEAVLAFLDRHGLSRFDEWGDRGPMIHNRAGTRKRSDGLEGFDFYLTPEGWKDACHGYSAKEVARACIQAGILEPDAIGKSAQSVSIPGHGKGRCYVIKAAARARYQEEEAA